MTAKVSKPDVKCPFWSETSKKCSIRHGGLFIPLDDHSEAYCKASHYSACKQYLIHVQKQNYLLQKVRKSELNRRQYLRIETSHNLTLMGIIKSGQLVDNFSSGAQTIDVSKGGLRMTTENLLLHDTQVEFIFDKSFPLHLHQITGQVEWCNKQIDEPGYQAGVSFLGDDVVEAMGRYLEQHQGHR